MINPNLEAVLKRDGTDVVTNSACSPTSGHWVSPYDNVATTLSSDLDIVSYPKLICITFAGLTFHTGPFGAIERGDTRY